jgi:hypothetical protein
VTDYSKSKFENAIAERLYTATLDGDGEEVTISDETWTRIDFDENLAIEVNTLLDGEHGRTCWTTYGLNHEVLRVTTGYYGAILYEAPQGFVKIHTLAEGSQEMDDAWDEITGLGEEVEVA